MPQMGPLSWLCLLIMFGCVKLVLACLIYFSPKFMVGLPTVNKTLNYVNLKF